MNNWVYCYPLEQRGLELNPRGWSATSLAEPQPLPQMKGYSQGGSGVLAARNNDLGAV
jgi:hypothetical protein